MNLDVRINTEALSVDSEKKTLQNVVNLSGGALTFAMFDKSVKTGKRLYPEVAHSQRPTFETKVATGKEYIIDSIGRDFTETIEMLKTTLRGAEVGDDAVVLASDKMFSSILPSWCNTLGHLLVETNRTEKGMRARIRKGANI